jgi:hypothetical protein
MNAEKKSAQSAFILAPRSCREPAGARRPGTSAGVCLTQGFYSCAYAINYQYFTKVEGIPENRGAGRTPRTPILGPLSVVS